MGQPYLVYDRLAEWWPLLSPVERYQLSARWIGRIIADHKRIRGRTALGLGMGGGCLAHLLKRRFRLTVSDISPAMLEVSRKFNPECPHVFGDFRSMRLGAEFVAVIAEDAISYVTTVEDLSSVMTTAYEHCLKGGVAVFIPEFTAETFVGDTYAGGANTRDAGLRYMRWTYLLEPPDPGYESIFVYLTKQKDAIEVLHERHRFGLFPRETWLSLMREVGFEPELVPFDDGRADMVQRDGFVGVKV